LVKVKKLLMPQTLGKYIIFIGIILVVAGLLLHFGGDRLKWPGHLPGDIRIEKENFRFYFPITTMIIVSVLLTLIIKLTKKLW
jgi:uncharacterized membrane protein